jgi:hypothetical protein
MRDESGYAFPHQEINAQSATESITRGMTLRDYFAAKAMQAWIQALSLRHKEPGYTDEGAINEAVRLSDLTADAMIKERGE